MSFVALLHLEGDLAGVEEPMAFHDYVGAGWWRVESTRARFITRAEYLRLRHERKKGAN